MILEKIARNIKKTRLKKMPFTTKGFHKQAARGDHNLATNRWKDRSDIASGNKPPILNQVDPDRISVVM